MDYRLLQNNPGDDRLSHPDQIGTVPWALEGLTSHGVLHGTRVGHALGGVQDLEADDIAVLVVVKNHSGLIFVAFLDGGIAQQDAERVDLGIVSYLHGFTQYFSTF